MGTLSVIFANHANASAPAAGGQLGDTGLYDITGGMYSITDGVASCAATSGEPWLLTNPAIPPTYTSLLIEADVYAISTYSHSFRLVTHAGGAAIPIKLNVYAGRVELSGPGGWGATGVNFTDTIPATGWTVQLEQTISGDTVTTTGRVLDKATSTQLATITGSLSAATTGLNTSGVPGVMFRTAATTYVARMTRIDFTADSGFSDPLGITTLTIADRSKTSITFGGGVMSGTSPVGRLMHSTTYAGAKTDVGAYTAGMIISGLLPRTKHYYTVGIHEEDAPETVVYSNTVMALTAGTPAGIVWGHIESSSGVAVNTDGDASAVIAARKLSYAYAGTPDAVTMVNCSIGSLDTNYLLPTGPTLNGHHVFDESVVALNAAGATVITITLGLNDASAQRSPATYISNLGTIIAAIFAQVPTLERVYLCDIKYPNGYGYAPATMPSFIHQYNDALDTLVNNTTIFRGDNTVYAITEAIGIDAYDGAGSPHPSNLGVNLYGEILGNMMIRQYPIADMEADAATAQLATDAAAVTAVADFIPSTVTVLGVTGSYDAETSLYEALINDMQTVVGDEDKTDIANRTVSAINAGTGLPPAQNVPAFGVFDPSTAPKQVIVTSGSSFEILARVLKPDGNLVTQASVSTIDYTITDESDDVPVEGTPVLVSKTTAISDTLLTDARWTVDTTGYNMEVDIGGLSEGFYSIRVSIHLTTGQTVKIPVYKVEV